jgi:hypothetical protein
MFLFMAFGVLLLVYALGFISDVYLFYAYGNKGLSEFYTEMQSVNAVLLWKAVLVIVFAVVLFILGVSKYPAGLFTLILVVLIAAASLFLSADSLLHLIAAREKYSGLDLSSLQRYIDRGAITYQRSTLTYDLGLGVHALFFCSSLFMAACVIRNAFRESL